MPVKRTRWWAKSKNPIILRVIHHHQNPSESTCVQTVLRSVLYIKLRKGTGWGFVTPTWKLNSRRQKLVHWEIQSAVNCMEYSRSWETENPAVAQEIPRPCSQASVSVLILSQKNPDDAVSVKSTFILPSTLHRLYSGTSVIQTDLQYHPHPKRVPLKLKCNLIIVLPCNKMKPYETR
jgi:hypothetical protein